jgi:excisionase family DNA binding protein
MNIKDIHRTEAAMDELLTPDEAAKLCKVDSRTIYRYIKDGRLPAYKVSRKALRILASDFIKFVKRHRA